MSQFRMAHTSIRVKDLEKSLAFYTGPLGMQMIRQSEHPDGRFTNTFVGYGAEAEHTVIEMTWNWDQEAPYTDGRNFGHLAFAVDDIYELCSRLQDAGVTILRPPRDGRMAFVRSPDDISIELLQAGDALEPREPWVSMGNTGTW